MSVKFGNSDRHMYPVIDSARKDQSEPMEVTYRLNTNIFPVEKVYPILQEHLLNKLHPDSWKLELDPPSGFVYLYLPQRIMLYQNSFLTELGFNFYHLKGSPL